MSRLTDSILDVPGITVGQNQDLIALTGCTVILCEAGAVAGVDQRGSAPGTRETDLLEPINLVQRVHAVVLAGGSAFGLAAADGAMQFLWEQKVGFRVGKSRVPIVPAAVLFDLGIGDSAAFPDAAMGFETCASASRRPLNQGNYGAGTGATAGKLFGISRSTKSGIGTASISTGRAIVGAIIAVNPFGDVIDSNSGTILAGLRDLRGKASPWSNTAATILKPTGRAIMRLASAGNTIIGVVATNARLTKTQATKIAQLAQNGVVRSIQPANTMLDGDTLFALSTERVSMDVNVIGAMAEQVVARAIRNAITASESAGGVPSAREWLTQWKLKGTQRSR